MFWNEVKKHYDAGSAHQFLIHFNVNDLLYDDVYGYLRTTDYLMAQLNTLGCELVLGYNTSEGIHFPKVGQWRNTQRALEVFPQYNKTGVFHFQSLATWIQTLRRIGEVEDVNLAEQEVDPQFVRRRLNADLAFDKEHEDPFVMLDAMPSAEFRRQLNRLLQQGRTKIGLVINPLELLTPNDPSLNAVTADEVQLLFSQILYWASDLDIRRRKHVVLLVTHNISDVHPNFTVNPEIPLIEIPFPNYEERLKFIEHLHDISGGSSQMRKTLGNHRDQETLARETIGLNLLGVHDVVQQAESVQQKAGGEELLRYRRESIKTFSRGVLELGETQRGPSGDGWYVMRVIRDIADGMKNRDLRRVPRGILLLGPPGTSKEYAARVLAGEANMTLVRLRYASQVGEVTININQDGNTYERNLNAGLNFIRGIAPTVVFIDGIEQAAPHATMNPEEHDRMLPSALVNAINDISLHGRVIWVGASQRPDLMPPIFRRYGIFDTKLIMLPPTGGGRVEILRIFCRGQASGNINFQSLVGGAETDGLTWRDLLLIVQRANNIARRSGRDTFTEGELRQALNDFVPDYSREMQIFMGLLALREANSRIMVPDDLLPEYQEFVDGNRVDKTRINKRLMELSNQLGLRN
ncbi:ATP-binding protein [Candidatus Poribacteria bacterium]|nr:ATP-binding protein [Candidatus Poribacteria bacterium]MYH79216.1 ATP-binding protein [Candidatus Poribacteria bacterium]MYK96815.1 ATP-binding protein [Candidatus Poribacteria bacterium]